MDSFKHTVFFFSFCATMLFAAFFVMSFPEHSLAAIYWDEEDWLSLILRVMSVFFIWATIAGTYLITLLTHNQVKQAKSDKPQVQSESA